MTDDHPESGGRLSKYSNADRRAAYEARRTSGGLESRHTAAPSADAPLTDILEHLIREGGRPLKAHPVAPAPPPPTFSVPPPAVEDGPLPHRLLEELHAAQEQASMELRGEKEGPPGRNASLAEDEPASNARLRRLDLAAFIRKLRLSFPRRQRLLAVRRDTLETWRQLWTAMESRLRRNYGGSGWPAMLRGPEWRRRYFVVLSRVHRHVFDRSAERLLFIKTPPLSPASQARDDSGRFVFEGPVPALMLKWAFSALPAPLTEYAFVDFLAGGGRTLLLAAARDFEYAAGYAFDARTCEELELNLAQYPRSYMACRDVRAVRGDADGVAVPQQPAVLYFPAAIPPAHLSILMSHVSASYRISPRALYLVFEDAEGAAFEHSGIFERVKLPVHNRIKAKVFGTAQMAVYRPAEARRPVPGTPHPDEDT